SSVVMQPGSTPAAISTRRRCPATAASSPGGPGMANRAIRSLTGVVDHSVVSCNWSSVRFLMTETSGELGTSLDVGTDLVRSPLTFTSRLFLKGEYHGADVHHLLAGDVEGPQRQEAAPLVQGHHAQPERFEVLHVGLAGARHAVVFRPHQRRIM